MDAAVRLDKPYVCGCLNFEVSACYARMYVCMC